MDGMGYTWPGVPAKAAGRSLKANGAAS